MHFAMPIAKCALKNIHRFAHIVSAMDCLLSNVPLGDSHVEPK